jgi:predicted deacylase
VRTKALLSALTLAALTSVPPAYSGIPDPHHDFGQVNARLHALVSANPGVARIQKVTTTPQGREVLALEVDLSGGFAVDTPILLLHGAIHGDEWGSAEVVLHLAELSLATRDARLRGLRVHFVPVINADGFVAGRRQAAEADGTWHDPNREFPVPFQPDHPSKAVIQGFRDYAGRGRLAGVLDYHSPAASISWPWAFTRDREPDGVAALKVVAEQMARSVGYRFGQTSKMISYRHQATAQDWFAYAHKVPALLIELDLSPWKVDHAIQVLIDQERPYWLFVSWLRGQVPSRPAAAGTSSSR